MLTDDELAAIEKMPGLAHAGGRCGCGECVGYLMAWGLVVLPLLAEVKREREAGYGEHYVDRLRAIIREQADEICRLEARVADEALIADETRAEEAGL